jgi:thymidylate kinase
LGTDGSGKSTIIHHVERDLAPAFRRTKRYHLRPFFGRHTDHHTPITNPHDKPLRNSALSLCKLALWWLDYTFGYLTEVFPRIVRSTIILFDRYYYDLSIDQKRYRYGGPLWLAKLGERFIPRPDLIIVLDASTEILLMRKQELPAREINRQRSAYKALTARLPNTFLVDSSQSLDKVLSQIESLVLDYLERRTIERLGTSYVATVPPRFRDLREIIRS